MNTLCVIISRVFPRWAGSEHVCFAPQTGRLCGVTSDRYASRVNVPTHQPDAQLISEGACIIRPSSICSVRWFKPPPNKVNFPHMSTDMVHGLPQASQTSHLPQRVVIGFLNPLHSPLLGVLPSHVYGHGPRAYAGTLENMNSRTMEIYELH